MEHVKDLLRSCASKILDSAVKPAKTLVREDRPTKTTKAQTLPEPPARPRRSTTMMKSAWLWSERSTCSRLHVGVVFSKDGRILVTGYNGAPSGLPHCNHSCNCLNAPNHDLDCRSLQFCNTAEHAERNAIAWAARNGVALEGCHVYVTHMPCKACAMALVNCGAVRVYYQETYRDTSGVTLLRQAGVEVRSIFVG